MQRQDQPESASRPVGLGQTEGFADGQIVVHTYGLSYFCPTEAFADLDPPLNSGNGIPAAADPLELQMPQCIIGDTGTGSVPTVSPTGEPVWKAPKVWGIVPAFAGVPGNFIDPETLRPVDSQCPEPGPPVTQHTGAEFTCTMHPAVLHAGHANAVAGLGLDPAVSLRHSHIDERTSDRFEWWWTQIVLVHDPDVWPDRDGNCRAGRTNCLTSVTALQRAQAAGQAGADMPTNIFFFYKSRPETPQPARGDPSGGGGGRMQLPDFGDLIRRLLGR